MCSKQIHRQTVPSDSNRKDEIESYYLRNIAIPFLDNVCVELHENFLKVITACPLFIVSGPFNFR